MTVHTKDALRRSRISQILNLLLTVSTLEAGRAKRLVSRQYGQVFYFAPTVAATVCAVVANK